MKKMTTGWLLTCILVTALACITRYAGIFLLPVGLCLILFNQSISLKKGLKHCLLFGCVSILPFIINIVRNDLLTGLAMGQRPKNDAGIFQILENFGGVYCDWLSIDRKPFPAIFLTIAVLFIFIGTLVFLYRQKKSGGSFERTAAVTGLFYFFFMLGTSALTRYEQFTSRLMSPLFIPLVWTISWWIPEFLSGLMYRYRLICAAVALCLAAVFLNIQMAADYEYYDGVKDAGVPGYREDPFVQSELVQFLGNYKTTFNPGLPIYSNAGEAVYFITGLPARQLPFAAFPARLQQYYATKNSYLVWFRDLDNPEMPSLDSILHNKNLQIVKELPGGAIYISK